MSDSTIKKVDSHFSPEGPMGQTYLVSGKSGALRLWDAEPPGEEKPTTRRAYETVGFVIAGRAELTIEGQRITLGPGDAWLVPKGAEHRYRVLEALTAIDATSPPAQVEGRDEP